MATMISTLLLVFMGAGCASAPFGGNAVQQQEALTAGVPPVILTNAMGVLLTNVSDFTARVTLQKTNASAALVAGNMFQQQGWILFVPMSDGAVRNGPSIRFRFLWDISRNCGYIISEALRGYVRSCGTAQYQVDSSATKFLLSSALPVDGRSCRSEAVTVRSMGDSATRFLVCRDESTGIALQIQRTDVDDGPVLQLTQLNPDRLDPGLFAPPAGFIRYESVEAMLRELLRKPRELPYSHTGP